MRRTRASHRVLVLAIAAAARILLAAAPAGANVEEFSTFDIGLQEHDDESTLDHFLTRFPLAWSDAWAHSTAGIRTSQGCLTSGEWFIDTDFRARAALGRRAWLGIDYFQSDSDILSTDHLDLSFHFPVAVGAATAMFRPSPNKASQDFAIGWEAGADTSTFQLRATWTLEDVFNNFWAFRQTQVGGFGEPYERRPYEPAVAFAVRQPAWWVKTNAKWLTPSTKRIVDLARGVPLEKRDLWGTAGHADAGVTLGAWTLEARSDERQALGRDESLDPSVIDDTNWRRQWSVEGAIRTTELAKTSIEARYVYQWRVQREGPAGGQGFLGVQDRMVNLEVLRELTPRFRLRLGGLFDRIGVARTNWPDFSWGTRNESRAYVGLQARFGRVWVAGIEGIELDPEPYPVTFHHDKGFLQLQTTF